MENLDPLEILTQNLRDVYDAEKQLTKALPKMAKAVNDEELAQGFRDHAAQTQEQARRIEQAFEKLGMKARSKPCAGMKGLIEEGQEIMGEEEGAALDVSLSAAARKVEHYEMMAYEALIAAATAAKQPEIVELLKQTLREEAETDKRLSTVGKRLMKEGIGSSRAARPESTDGKGARATRGAASAAKSNGKSARGSQSSNGRGKGQSGNGSHLSNTTTDPDEIRQWAEERGGKPACVKGTGGKGDIGLLRIEFPGKPNAKDDKLSPISWEDFFEKFEERGLALVYQDHTAQGKQSNFNKLIAREEGSGKASGGRKTARAGR